MNIYYQNEFYGREVADSIGRYLKVCLNLKNIEKFEIICEKNQKVINNSNTEHLFVFTNVECNCTYWIRLVNNMLKDVEKEDIFLNVIDLTMQRDFPMTTDTGEVISFKNYGCINWLSKVTVDYLNQKPKLKLKEDCVESWYGYVKHKVFDHNIYSSIEDFIDSHEWYNLKDNLLEIWERVKNET